MFDAFSWCIDEVKIQERAKFRSRLQRQTAFVTDESTEDTRRNAGPLCNSVYCQAAGCDSLTEFVDDRARIPLTLV